MGFLQLTDWRHARYLSDIAETVHDFGAKAFLQLSPGLGCFGRIDPLTGERPGAPSEISHRTDIRRLNGAFRRYIESELGYYGRFVKWDSISKMPDWAYWVLERIMESSANILDPSLAELWRGPRTRELTLEEVEQAEDNCARAAAMAIEVGFDGVEIHAASGILINNFLSPRTNKRCDRYGGGLKNRMRFLRGILKKTRRFLGDGVPVGVRLAGREGVLGGMDFDETLRVARMVSGFTDYLHVSDGCFDNLAALVPDSDGTMLPYSRALKEACDDVVITPGIHEPDSVEAAIAGGSTDIVSFGRQAICDPDWPEKVGAGRKEEVIRCSRCNQCGIQGFKHKKVSCSLNPKAGFEKYLPEYWRVNSPGFRKRIGRSRPKGEAKEARHLAGGERGNARTGIG